MNALKKALKSRPTTSPTPAPLTRIAERTLALQDRTLQFRGALVGEKRLRLSVELNKFADSEYIAVGFNENGLMSPALILVGYLTQPQNPHDTPVAQCRAYWVSSHALDGIVPHDLENTAVDTCAMQRGYGTVALQISIDMAANKRLRDEVRANNASAQAVVLPLSLDSAVVTFAYGPRSADALVPLQFHNENCGSTQLQFNAIAARDFSLATAPLLLTVHGVLAVGLAFLALARVMAPPLATRSVDAPWWRRQLSIRVVAALAGLASFSSVQRDHRPHAVDMHAQLGLLAIAVALCGPSLWKALTDIHAHVVTTTVLLAIAQVCLGLAKIGNPLIFAVASIAIVLLLLLTENTMTRIHVGPKGSLAI